MKAFRDPRATAKKSLGQHFLNDQHVLHKIAELARPPSGSGLIEVGPGTGNLTAHLLGLFADTAPAPLCAIERDARMIELIGERFQGRVPVIEGDAAALNWQELLTQPLMGPQPVVVGNLPYYAAMHILFAVAQAPTPPFRMVFMLQREVADRLVAQPSTPAYGQISVKLQLICDIKLALKVGPGAFSPPPKVDSAVVVLTPLAAPRYEAAGSAQFSRIVSAGFAQRRKTVVNSLLSTLPLQAVAIQQALAELGLDPRIRGEALTLKQWASLSLLLARQLGQIAGAIAV